MGFAAVARVTPDRWIACSVKDDIAFGLEPGGELDVKTTICNDVRSQGEPIVINHVAEDSVYRDHPTPELYGFQSYISMPIVRADGRFFGTLCAIDPRPARLMSPEIVGVFRMFAQLIAAQLDANERLATSEASLLTERKTAQLREQFIAVLGHDLRNPLASIDAGARILRREPLSERAMTITGMMQKSVQRMARLIDDVLDLARGRLGGGIILNRRDEAVGPILEQVIDELRAAWPNREVDARFDLPDTINCDRSRMGQLFSNLLGNALTHGAADRPVRVEAQGHGGVLEFVVENAGPKIPAAALPHLFQPFSRGEILPHQQGLGLGLYIASEIAHAHGGTLSAESTDERTVFTFRMPLIVN